MVYTNPFGITKEMVLEVLKETSRIMKDFKKNFVEKNNLIIGNKLMSELIGKIVEIECATVFSKYLGGVDRAISDNDPDLRFSKIIENEKPKPLEVKLTSTLTGWQGGAFSKRPFDYLLVSWGGEFDEFFAAITHIDDNEWDLTGFNKGKRYGPSFNVRKLFEKTDKQIFIGDFQNNSKSIKLVRQKV